MWGGDGGHACVWVYLCVKMLNIHFEIKYFYFLIILLIIFRIKELPNARLEPLVRFLPLVLDKLLLLVVKPPNFGGRMLDVGQAAFNAIAEIVNKISNMVNFLSNL